MDILVVSRVSIPATETTIPAWQYLRSLGHTVHVCHPYDNSLLVSRRERTKIDVIISMGVTVQDETRQAINMFPRARLMCFNWDCYHWIWKKGYEGKVQTKNPSRPREYNYIAYGDLLSRATEIWVPSECTGWRAQQWWGLTNWYTIKSSIPYWEYDNVKDDGYALCCLREIPDPYWGVLEKVCRNLDIPLHMPKHELSYQEYQREVAHCRFLVAPLYELSTGGLSLLEGYYHGKPVLLSDSKWNGGRDYLGDRAMYFEHGNEDDFKAKLVQMYNNAHYLYRNDHKQFVVDNYSDHIMINKMVERIEHYG